MLIEHMQLKLVTLSRLKMLGKSNDKTTIR